MNRYGIETIAESVYQSSVCPFMRERCANGNEDCQKCVKEWFVEHDKKIIADELERIVAELEEAKSLVPVNRLLDDIICDKPKELGMLIAYDEALKIVRGEKNERNE